MNRGVLKLGSRLIHQASDRQTFISLSQNYHKDDEKRLPYPEVSVKGRSLYKMCEALKNNPVGVVISPKFEDPALYLMRAKGINIFTANESEIAACITGQNQSDVFDYWRNNCILELGLKTADVSFWLNPKISDLEQHSENILAGFVGEDVDDSILEYLGSVGILHARKVNNGFWLSRWANLIY